MMVLSRLRGAEWHREFVERRLNELREQRRKNKHGT